MADDLVVREWNCGGWLTPKEQCITIYEPREYLPLGRAIGEHNALARAYLERDAQLAAMKRDEEWRNRLRSAMERRLDEYETQLAAMMAERDEFYRQLRAMDVELAKEKAEVMALCQSLLTCEEKLTASEAHSENLDKSLTRTEAKLKAATETLERVNGRAQSSNVAGRYWYLDVLRDIRAMCTEALTPRADGVERMSFSMFEHLSRQRRWSEKTFGPGSRSAGVVAHIRKELAEIEADPADLTEWIDVVILALDGAWRTGATPRQIIDALVAKQARNEARKWPDWRTADPNGAIEHVREP